MKKGDLYIGCSGFYNNDWKGSLYPEDAKSKDFLSLYSQKFNSVEINSTFYRKPTSKTLLKWADETPDDFKFFIKIPKTISHEKRLKDCKEEISEFCNLIQASLKEKLSGFLYQFPPSFKNSQENIDLILTNLDFNFLNVIEFRHESWWRNEIFKILKEHNIVFSGVTFPGNLSEDVIVNHPEILYYRLHGKPILYKSEYSEEFLHNLAEKIKANQKKTFIFFNNTWGDAAIKNSLYLKRILE
ncbi:MULTISPECIES: DUF72 domain-containing protein [Chryseobacterium]|uniref:Uncharacterized protein YecE (DUF72 family) n=1 Tax=Chryseobacterium geocarposphaerae TaxID=1416776 RepID=A0ABU1LGE8_9FLAO|nr:MULTISPECIES: DUF72 domain-containing protein [Chryseobacterium]MDR6405630.1 uncharacterized protein YecE (DUF72 family) [Chryseobacterium geocarposphaerae]MDR6698861.1 uncharacterized protein YecE (DUF72 family) [Chryseobacterium ginsenosidimutans]